MPSHRRIQTVLLATSLALGLNGGCASTAKKESKNEQSAGSILSTGPEPKVTNLQTADVQIALGRSFEEEGKPEEARAAYLSALKLNPKRADAELRLAILEDRKANAKEADRHFAQALKLEPRSPEIFCDQGYSFYQRNLLNESETALKAALALDPLHQRSHNNLGLVLARRGDTQGALQEFTKAGCDPSDARANLGLALAMDGKFDESKKLYVQALAAKPSSAPAMKGLQATIAALAGQGDALAIATRAAKPETPASPADPAVMRTSGQSGSTGNER
jgi:Tfp pilus assembly protein PilF